MTVRKVAPQTSKVQVYFGKKMNFVEYFIFSINQLESRGQTSIKKDYQSIYYCCPKQQRLFAFYTNKNSKAQKVSCLCLH